MQRFIRNYFLYFALVLLLASLGWAVSFGTLPPADFTFDNNTEIKTIDPALATGQPEGRVLDALYEGLLADHPDPSVKSSNTGDFVPLTPQPGVAESFDLSEDRLTYTFHIRPTAKWSNGTSMSSEDFVFSWMRMLHPETASEYAYQLHYVAGAEDFNSAKVEVGSEVEVELDDRPDPVQLFPRGTIVRGKLHEIVQPEESGTSPDASNDAAIYVVEVTTVEPQAKLSEAEQTKIKQSLQSTLTASRKPTESDRFPSGSVLKMRHILPDFNATVAIKAPDPATLIVTLRNPTPYFAELVAFYPLYPVNRQCVEKFGAPGWTKPENLVCNGPFTLQFRRFRDRLRLVKNERYWNAEKVKLNVVDVMAIKSETTGLNMYLNGQIDWLTTVNSSLIPEVKAALPNQYFSYPMLTLYFYRLNTTHPPLDNKLVRQALARAINRKTLTEFVTKGGEVPADSLVPPGLHGYESPPGPKLDLEEARRLLAEAGFPGGHGLPHLDILYNSSASHQELAEVVQQQWRENLGVDVGLRNLEWGVFLDALSKREFIVARSGWIGDYADPNTFLDMFVTDGPNNQTGWGNAEYDRLIREAAGEGDEKKRMQLFHQAETILLDEMPIIPVYYQVSKNLVRPGVKGFTLNSQDRHPLTALEVLPRTGARP